MELGWSALALMCMTAALVWFWQDSLAAREQAAAAAAEACRRLGLQFLDDAVAFARLSLTRNADGRLALQRTYVFDYTANSIERRQGFVILTGRRVDSVGYAPEDGGRGQSPGRSAAEPPARRADPGNIITIEDWRSRTRPLHQRPIKRQSQDGEREQR
ncbi:MAG TPA: DUF3301 domain-containing protein [Steroidobacter sp.]|nr:DUF3301 domain-containing protein [Steroidobacter sp.]